MWSNGLNCQSLRHCSQSQQDLLILCYENNPFSDICISLSDIIQHSNPDSPVQNELRPLTIYNCDDSPSETAWSISSPNNACTILVII